MAEDSMAITAVDYEEGTALKIVDDMGSHYGVTVVVEDSLGKSVSILMDTRVVLGALNQLKKLNKGRNRAFPIAQTDYYSLEVAPRRKRTRHVV